MTNETPPVPPNCPMLIVVGNQLYIELEITGLRFDYSAQSKHGRPIIAAVASMYWRREASSKLTVNIDEHLLALDNAAAWERWGEQG